jgi:predicted O-methyltransferase YrrM
MIYVGDVSREDAQVLASLARSANRILEFGVGASTQIFAQAAPAHARIISLETESLWISKTEAVLEALGKRSQVEFRRYSNWIAGQTPGAPAEYDVIFDDGVDELRMEFARKSWPSLKLGGALVFHDTRRRKDARNLFDFCAERQLEIESVQVNAGASNMSIVTRKIAQPYVDWNKAEGRTKLMMGYGSIDDTVAYVRERQREG